MKYIRYAFIAALVYCFALSIKGIVSPEIAFTLAGGTELSHSDVDPHVYADAIAKYRTTVLPWLALIGLILCGWIFLRQKKVVLGVTAASLGLLAYIIFDSIRGLGYTVSQSLSAVFQGHGTLISGWAWFYLIALTTLLIVAMQKAGEGNAEKAV